VAGITLMVPVAMGLTPDGMPPAAATGARALGSWLSGALFEATGGYGAAFGVASALLLGASALSATINERPRPAAQLAPVAGGTSP